MSDSSLEDYDRLLTRIYDAALQPERWAGVLRALAGWLGAPKALLFTPKTVPADGGFYYVHGLTPQDMALWATRYQRQDFWLERMVARRLDYEGSVVLDRDLHTEAELLASPWYREFLVQLDIARAAMTVVLSPSPSSAGEPVAAFVGCSLFRGPTEPAFDGDTRRRLGLVLPHLSRALSVMFRLRDAEHRVAAGEGALHALDSGVLLFDGGGRVVFMNRAAERLVRQGRFDVGGGKLQLPDAQAQREWQDALRASLAMSTQARVAHFAESVTVANPGEPGACMLQLSRLPQDSQFGLPVGAARVIAFVTERDAALRIDPGLLTRTWGLSRAEARTATALSDGGRLHDVAARLGLSANTLKTQLHQVYQKTGCASRADLTRLLLSLRGEAVA